MSGVMYDKRVSAWNDRKGVQDGDEATPEEKSRKEKKKEDLLLLDLSFMCT